MAKRGDSGLSLVVGVDKPLGLSSHDVVGRCRRIFGEKRVGHVGTLDPLATGTLLVCVGPAARLDKYLVGHDKTYEVEVAFGASTETDDREGTLLEKAAVPSCVYEEDFARLFVKTLVGKTMQVPPLYSAIKKDGKKACDEARRGNVVELEARPVEIYQVEFLGLQPEDEEYPWPRWRLSVSVSKGTYIRSFARDLGRALNTAGHVYSLRRTVSGCLRVEDCATLEALQDLGARAALDPLPLLGYRFAFLDDASFRRADNGNVLRQSAISLMQPPRMEDCNCPDCCFPSFTSSKEEPTQGELVSLVYDNKVVAIYRYDSDASSWKADCIFKPGIVRGGTL